MAKRLFLADHVHAVGVNGDLVFLDVERDAYVCLPEGEHRAPLEPGRRALCPTDPGMAQDLLEVGLVQASWSPANSCESPQPPALATPAKSALRDRYGVPTLRDGMQIAVAIADMLAAYRGRPFKEIVDAGRAQRTRPPSVSEQLVETVDDFHRWAPFAPTSAKCLLRAFMLLRLLRRQGHDALWVFGVRTWPFHAHCWLQCEDLVLDDEPDRIRAFTPIMVL
ncbi:lasso peptide biosynthesis B2 protein [Phenylobacterium sp. SCN 70-31]|uniref:lasso peptide biosynthesis B2 protein n=1 Tax=Phenylobacterium sp. SCN 70-31 TaxID=1660129 RepID=UPI00086E61B6|nr:lasso peptide biosynthesis B2 protein [Phenylobacterium sp. SCN 70-31]ODT85796.1 MAG: hypothetical protein ABS78_19135 [Phenylobacterium sp. SCN 70-31]